MTLYIDEMARLGIYLDNLSTRLVHSESDSLVIFLAQGDHPYLRWNERMQRYFKYVEHQSFHRYFAHPQLEDLFKFLQKNEVSDVSPTTRCMRRNIVKHSSLGEKYAQKSCRFNFTWQEEVECSPVILEDVF